MLQKEAVDKSVLDLIRALQGKDYMKDFIDLYFLLTEHDYSVEKLLNNYQAKSAQRNSLHALKSLTYFEEIDLNDWPELLKKKNTSWDEVQNTLGKACDEYVKKIT